jgi:hypothetical protein
MSPSEQIVALRKIDSRAEKIYQICAELKLFSKGIGSKG